MIERIDAYAGVLPVFGLRVKIICVCFSTFDHSSDDVQLRLRSVPVGMGTFDNVQVVIGKHLKTFDVVTSEKE